jgi:hypothetical protein
MRTVAVHRHASQYLICVKIASEDQGLLRAEAVAACLTDGGLWALRALIFAFACPRLTSNETILPTASYAFRKVACVSGWVARSCERVRRQGDCLGLRVGHLIAPGAGAPVSHPSGPELTDRGTFGGPCSGPRPPLRGAGTSAGGSCCSRRTWRKLPDPSDRCPLAGDILESIRRSVPGRRNTRNHP